VRAADTAAQIAAALALPLQGWMDLHEGGGIYLDLPVESGPEGDALTEPVGQPGKSRSELQNRCPQLILPEAVNEQGWWNRPFENDVERPVRARRVLEALVQNHGALRPDGSEDRVGIVSHGNFYNYFMRAVMGLPPPSRMGELSNLWFEINNTGVTRIDYQAPYFTVIYMNRTDFLPPELIT
jgi:2,3-bisphosphoglycerate-dependent phosphoglycerate mutase